MQHNNLIFVIKMVPINKCYSNKEIICQRL